MHLRQKKNAMKHLFKKACVFIIPFVLVTTAHAATNFVWQGSPSPAVPYSTWATAAHVIQDAVDVAEVGNVVLVTNGVYATGGAVTPEYELMNRIVITKAIIVYSVNGPEDTIIMGVEDLEGILLVSNAVRGVYMGGGARLTGFTVKNGYTKNSGSYVYNQCGGGIFQYENSIVSNCIIIGCTAYSNGGGICASIISPGGTF